MSTVEQNTSGEIIANKPAQRKAGKLGRIMHEEFGQFHLRLLLLDMLLAPLPMYVGGRMRTRLFQLAGFQIGQGTVIWGTPTISGNNDLYRRLSIGLHCAINMGCFLDLGADITIGDNVSIGHEVMILTTSHKMGSAERRAGDLISLPVRIENGAWLGARSTILPGVTIGAGAIVSAGSVVNKDVPPNTIAAGSPARVVVPKIR